MVDAERLHGKFRESAIVGADAIEEHHQVTAVKDGGDAACLLHDRGQGDLDEDGVGAVEVASENPFVFGAVDYRSDEWGDPVAGLVYPVLSKLRIVEDLRAYLMGSDGAFITGSDLLIDGGVIAAMRAGRL